MVLRNLNNVRRHVNMSNRLNSAKIEDFHHEASLFVLYKYTFLHLSLFLSLTSKDKLDFRRIWFPADSSPLVKLIVLLVISDFSKPSISCIFMDACSKHPAPFRHLSCCTFEGCFCQWFFKSKPLNLFLERMAAIQTKGSPDFSPQGCWQW